MQLPPSPSVSLAQRNALVVGASSGIGVACAAALGRAGAHVVCAARNTKALQDVITAMEAENLSAEAMSLDIADVARMDRVLAARGCFDIVVNSAGMARHGPAVATVPDDYQAVMDVNARGAYFLSVFTARAMIKAGRAGSIIHISSQMGHVGGVDRAVYCASKHALEGMTRTFAIEWGEHGIRVNTVCPTFIRTPLTEATFSNPERIAWIMDKIKLGRIGNVSDVMGAVVYLAGDASALVTGTSIRVDGGWTAG